MSVLQIVISALLAVSVMVGISMMSRVRTAVAGNMLSALAMLAGVAATLFFSGVVSAWTIWPSMLAGALIGSFMASRVKMIQMPQTVALFNGLGGGASALVGLLTAMGVGLSLGSEATGCGYQSFVRCTSLLAIAVGMITLTGSLVAAGKLHRWLPQQPLVWKAHSSVTLLLLAVTIVGVALGAVQSSPSAVRLSVIIVLIASSLFGLYFSVRVGGADMPITISLLNSLSGVAGSIAGMAMSDVLLVAVGGIVGASGLLLTQIMCRAMNRSLISILTGGVTGARREEAVTSNEEQLIKRVMELEKRIQDLENIVSRLEERVQQLQTRQSLLSPQAVAATAGDAGDSELSAPDKQDAAAVLSAAKDVIIVPGYGMALAQAQHQVRQLADRLESRGARVRYAIHPVAGRMPGHMNVLLAEADVDYEKLYEMKAINEDFARCDAVVVVGASDVLNPAARNAVGTPIYGMPVLNVDQAPQVIICNYDLKPGYAGVDNPIYAREQGVYLELGDAKETLTRLIGKI